MRWGRTCICQKGKRGLVGECMRECGDKGADEGEGDAGGGRRLVADLPVMGRERNVAQNFLLQTDPKCGAAQAQCCREHLPKRGSASTTEATAHHHTGKCTAPFGEGRASSTIHERRSITASRVTKVLHPSDGRFIASCIGLASRVSR